MVSIGCFDVVISSDNLILSHWIPRAIRIAGCALFAFALILVQTASGQLSPGMLNDFESGELEGWTPPKANTTNVPGGPTGSTRFLEVAAGPTVLAAFNTNFAGTIDPTVTAVSMDMMRPQGESDIDMRLVLFGPGTGNRWTSTEAQTVLGDGAWRNYAFSTLEIDLTHVSGAGTYDDLNSNLDRLMFRNDEGEAGPANIGMSGTQAPGTGTFGVDNIMALPLPVAGFTDYDDDGTWNLGDLNLVLFNWQQSETTLPSIWVNQRPATVGLDSLNNVLFNWQQAASLPVVPEPTTSTLAAMGLFCVSVILKGAYRQSL